MRSSSDVVCSPGVQFSQNPFSGSGSGWLAGWLDRRRSFLFHRLDDSLLARSRPLAEPRSGVRCYFANGELLDETPVDIFSPIKASAFFALTTKRGGESSWLSWVSFSMGYSSLTRYLTMFFCFSMLFPSN